MYHIETQMHQDHDSKKSNDICFLAAEFFLQTTLPREPRVVNRQHRMALASRSPLSPLRSEATLGELLSWPPAHPPLHGPVGLRGLSSEQLVCLAAWARSDQACPLELGGPCGLQPPHAWGPSGLPAAPSGSPHPGLGGPPDLSISRVTEL